MHNVAHRVASPEHTCVARKGSDPMAIYFTSGTTGAPKMTEHSHVSHGIGLGFNGRWGKAAELRCCASVDVDLLVKL